MWYDYDSHATKTGECVDVYSGHTLYLGILSDISLLLFWPPVCLQLECQCQKLHSEQNVTKVENAKLKQANDELAQELERTSQELILAQEQLSLLQEQSTQLHDEKEMWVILWRISITQVSL